MKPNNAELEASCVESFTAAESDQLSFRMLEEDVRLSYKYNLKQNQTMQQDNDPKFIQNSVK